MEGFYLETLEGLIFTVKGNIHPPKAFISYIRYVPHREGDRQRNGKKYLRVYSFKDQFKVLESYLHKYVWYDEVLDEVVQGVPRGYVALVYDPRAMVAEMAKRRGTLSPLEKEALDLLEVLRDRSGASSGSLGISGSILVKLATEGSDIDVVVYGSKDCFKVHDALHELLDRNEEGLKRLSIEGLKKLYESRGMRVPLEKFIEQECRKVIQAKFRDKEFFIRFVKSLEEVDERYGDRLYKSMGRVEIKAKVIDASESIFTPCIYRVSEVEFLKGGGVEDLREIVSFRGRFCEQAVEGELVIARGKLEKVLDRKGGEYFRLLLGGSAEDCLLAI